ncbi:SDR family NAD(P)-dependent oxidoreductase [Streptomyces sp. NPDC021212]|uniref:SDR family NAD(P)-dependent oxidoreductase n=1 Tax=Streptomyces sp. NPDC021212 TaxID=3365118 RepID=UPI0037ACBE84
MEPHQAIRCRLTLTSANPIVDDHRVHGVRTLPGVTFLDIVYRLLDERGFALDRTELRDVLFIEPVVTTDEFDREIEVTLEPGPSGHRVRARSRKLPTHRPAEPEDTQDTLWTAHMEAELRLGTPFPEARPASAGTETEEDGTARREDVERVYALGRAADIHHRPFMKCHGTIHHRADGLLAEIALGEEARESDGDFLLHPAVLDAATMQSYAVAFLGDESDPRPLIPFHITAFRARGPLPHACRVRLRVRDGAAPSSDLLTVDIDLHDADGRLVARFERLALKRIRSRELITRLTRPDAPADAPSVPAAPGAPASPAASEAGPDAGGHLGHVRQEVVRAVQALLGDSAAGPVAPDQGFYELGLDSTQLLALVRTLEQRWGIDLYPTLLFEYTTVDSVAAYLAGLVPADEATPADEPAPADAAAPADEAATLCLTGGWSRDDTPPPTRGRQPRTVLLVADDGAWEARVREAVRRLPGAPDVPVARPGSYEDYRTLLGGLARRDRLPDAVVHLGPAAGPGGVAALPEAVEQAAASLLALSRALLEAPAGTAEDTRLPLLHLAAADGELAATVPGALSGLAQTVRIEQPRLRPTVVELGGSARPEDEALSALLRRELAQDTEPWVRYEGARRHVRRYREVRLGDPDPLPLRDRGVYLVSGGNGGLGRLFAERLARDVRARLVLFGRSAPDAATRAGLRALERHGAEVSYVRADVGDAADVARVVREARSRFGEIHGVIHAAGVLRDGLVRHKTEEDVRRVLAPKVRGVVHLDEATRDEPLDFFALFSSATGTVGNAGQSDYAVANAFLNAYARQRRAAAGRPGRSLALGWPLWADGGMRADEPTEEYFRRHGQIPLRAGAGAAAFLAGLGREEADLVLFHGDRQRILRSLDASRPGAPFDLRMAAPSGTEAPERAPGGVRVSEPAPAAVSGAVSGPTAAGSPGEIAVIGLAGRYPMASDLDELWANLAAGRDCVSEIPENRWPRRDFYDPRRNTPGRSSSKWGGFLGDADRFDPSFFQITPREAEAMDPQERLFLETVWHTMEDAGRTREALAGSRTGVFAGVMFNQYQMLGLEAPERLPVLPSSFSSSVANRVSYFFDFRGPSLAVDTMCSSSLVAIHLACQSLRSGDCDIAFAGGVNVITHPYKYLHLSQVGFVSSDGRCRSFGAGGDGYVPGEGVGAVLLKPLERALADGDRVHGVIKGSAVNHGGRSGGFFVPNPAAQAELLREALDRSGVDPDTLGFLEAHGTGTSLGDPIEMSALERVFGGRVPGAEPIPIGSVKSNIGHLEPAAGIAGLTKVLLQMRHRTLVPSLHADRLNPAVDWDATRFRVQRSAARWEEPVARGGERLPRRAGVSAFGAGGANGHVIVEEWPGDREPSGAEERQGPHVVVLSAKKEENLRRLAERYLALVGEEAPPARPDGQPRTGRPGPAAARPARSEVLAELSRIAGELSGLAGATPDPDAGLDEWGLDAADLRRFEQEIADRLPSDGPRPRLDLGSTLTWVADRLTAGTGQAGAPDHGAPAPDAPGVPSLASIAYTSQTGREAMPERLALVVSDTGELREALRDFLRGGGTGDRVHRGTATRPAWQGGRAGRESPDHRDPDTLARLWADGRPVDWHALYDRGAPPRTDLPLYPFTRRRCWVEATGSPVRPAGDGTPEETGPEFTYVTTWRRTPVPEGPAAEPAGPVLLVYPEAGRALADALADRYPHRTVVRAELGTRTRRLGEGRWEVDRAAPEAFGELRTELTRPGTVYFLGGLGDPAGEAVPGDPGAGDAGPDAMAALERAEELGVRALFRCARELAVPLAGSAPLSWKIVTHDVWAVDGAEPARRPYAGGLAGLARVLENEHPRWTLPVVDLGLGGILPGPADPRWGELADRIVAEPAECGLRVAHRAGARHVQALRPEALPAPVPGTIRTGGTYVIIGGAGGIGLETARFLARDHAARVALIGRGPLDDERRRRIADADPDGSRLAYVRADASDVASLRAALDRVHERFGPVHGVVHSALDHTTGALVRHLDEADLRAGLAAKSGVSVALTEVFGGEPLDFLLLYSSAQSFLGDPGLAPYAAGSTFQDALAAALDQRMPYPVRVVDWGHWGTVGAAATDSHRKSLTAQGFRSISPDEGRLTVLRTLGGDCPQVLALPAEARLLRRLGLEAAGSTENTRTVAVTETVGTMEATETVGTARTAGRSPEAVPPVSAPSLLEHDLPLDASGAAAIADFHALDGRMADAARGWLLRLLDGMGAWQGPHDAADERTVGRRIGVVPRYERLLGTVLGLLHEAGLLRLTADGYAPEPGALDRCRTTDHAARLDELADDRADLAVFVRLLSLCLGRYPELLRGELIATDLLFPSSGTSLMEGVYKGNPISDVYNDVLTACVLAHVRERLPALADGERIRILEVGSGTGGTSAGLLRALEPYGDRLEYTYTDLSAAFLAHGRREYGDAYPFLRFKRLDADRDLGEQGFAPGSYDLVVAANVIHATRDIRRALGHIKAALRAGGWLLLNELTAVTVQSTVTYGLFDGWWSHDDTALRLPGSPLLDAAGWRAAATALGYSDFAALPGDRWTTRNFQHVLIAQSDGTPVTTEAEETGAVATAGTGAAGAAESDRGRLRASFQRDVLRLTSDASGIALDDLDPDQELGSFGFDSVSYSLLAGQLNESFGFDITPTVFYETATLRALIDKLASDWPAVLRERYATEPAAPPATPAPPATAAPAPAPAAAPAAARGDEPVAIVGMAGLLPGSADLDAFWRHLVAGDDLVTPVPTDRPALRSVTHPGAFIDGVDLFDPLFFGISPREAEGMDPQQRLFLQTVWTGLEDAGIAPGSLAGSTTALFVGVGSNDYQELQMAAGAEIDAYAATANTHSILVNRISYLLDLHGPSEPVNTGCSSSLVALHRAAEAIRAGACEVAVAGGVNLLLSPRNYELLDRTGMLSPRGRCQTFDSAADGFVRGEGMGLVVLMSRDRARAAGHRVRGWLRGSAVNHGGRARSLTAPNPAGQAGMLVEAYRRAGVDPATVGYIETHGTGTELGDPVEVDGLKTAFARLFADRGTAPQEDAYCALGAVKTNIGHLESAAGIAGVLKVLLAMEHRTLPPSLHLRRPNPYLRLEGSPFRLVTEAEEWRRRHDGQGREVPLRAGVSSFGYGGVNAHVVLEEGETWQGGAPSAPALPEEVFVLSARTADALRAYAAALEAYVAGLPADVLRRTWADIAHTLRVGRDAMEHRLAVVASGPAELTAALAACARGEAPAPGAGLFTGTAGAAGAPHRSPRPGEEGPAADPWALARMWADGAEVDWNRLPGDRPARLLPLPAYPFERTRHWFEEPRAAGAAEITGPPQAAEHQATAGEVDDLLYTPRWVATDPPPAGGRPATEGPVWLVHTDDGTALADALADRLAPRPVVRIRADQPRQLDAGGLVPPATVHFLAGVRRPAAALPGEHLGALATAEETGVLALFRLVKRLFGQPAGGPGIELTVVTSDACPAAEGPLALPASAALWGFAKSLRRECPGWRIATLDLAWDEVVRDPVAAAGRVLAVTGHPGAELAVRDGRFLRNVLEPAERTPAAPARPPHPERLRANGVHVVIGGAGDVGLDVAAHLVRHHGARVALVGRSSLDGERRARLERIDPSGERWVHLRADAADPEQLRRVADTVTRRFGPVNGVVQAANVLCDGALHTTGEARFRQGLESKTRTTAAVVDVFGKEPLDFLLIFSSVQSFLGNPGQSGYAAGCAFQDAYAHALAAGLPYPVRVVNWGAWGTSALVERHRDRLAAAGVTPIPPARGLRAMDEVLGREGVQMAVVSGSAEFLAGLGVRRVTAPADAADATGAEGHDEDWGPALLADVHRLVCEAAKVSAEALRPDAELGRFGFDSIAYTRLSHTFNETFGLDVTPAFFFGISTTLDLVAKMTRTHPEELRQTYAPQAPAPTPAPVPVTEPVRPRPTGDTHRDAYGDAYADSYGDAVAVVGMAGKLPQSEDLDEFWAHLAAGDDLITEIPADRWDWRGIYGDAEPGEFKTLVKWGGFMRRVDEFDPLFFGISPTEAEAMDPQHRLALEAVWSCVEDAGISPSALATTDTGVFLGAGTYDYFEIQHAFATPLDGYNSIGRSHAILANRISYVLDLRGPSEAIDTACSSSLVAVHRAVEAIRHGDCAMALAGGVNVVASPTLHVDTSQAGMLSTADGRCKTFDARADGYVRSEGVGVVLLKRLSAAIADGDVIHGVIRGSAVNHGGRTNSLTAPNPDAQAAVVTKAHRRAGIDPRTVTYVETHGTGTSLGDPIEIEGLRSAFATLYREWGVTEPPAAHCALGAVKSNTGHLEAAAGMAGLFKTLLAMRHGVLPKNLHIEEVNPHLRLDGSPFGLLREARPWQRTRDAEGREVPLRGGVSSFGLGGVNAHVVVEEFRGAGEPAPAAGGPGIFVLSARDGERLRAHATRLAEWLREPPAGAGPASVARTLQTGRVPMDERLAIVADDLADLRGKLLRWLEGDAAVAGVVSGNVRALGTGSDLLLDGPEGREYLRMVIAGGKREKLARLWVGGAPVDWELLWPDGAPRRIPLPTYPFARERYWLRPGEHFERGRAPEAYEVPEAPEAQEPYEAGPAAEPEPVPAAEPAPAAPVEEAGEPLESTIATLLGGHLGIDPAGLLSDRVLADYGVDSLGLRRLSRALGARYGVTVPARFFSTDKTIADLARTFREMFPEPLDAAPVDTPGPDDGFRSLLDGISSGRVAVEEALTRLGRGTAR